MTERVRIPSKWRPPLTLVVVSVLLSVLALPAAVILWAGRLDLARGLSANELIALTAAVLLTLIVAYVLARTITNPINALIARTEAIARSGKPAIQPLDAYGTREIALLSQSFLDLATTMIDRTEYIRSFAAHVSHELKSPLTAIRGAAELMRDEQFAMTPAERQHFLDNIVADAERLDHLLQRLRQLAYAEFPTSGGQVPLATLGSSLAARFPQLEITLEPKDAVLPLREDAAFVALLHLTENANQHGATALRLSFETRAGNTTLSVADNGSGIPPADRAAIFQPFFSTRRESGGTGLGLAIARAALRSQGSDIALADSRSGTTFEITLPTQ